MLETISSVLQVIVGLGLLNVWLLRARRPTAYRGGEAQDLKAEFEAYGLPVAAFYVVGGLKIAAAVLLIVGVWVEPVVVPAAAVVALLMAGALVMHARVGDPPLRSLPALLVLLSSAAICVIPYLR